MAISQGSTGTFLAELEDNGNPIALPAGSVFSWSTDDTGATVTVSDDTTQAQITVTADDPATSITITASTTDPTGTAVSGSITVPITPGVSHTFTVLVSQLS